VLKPDVVFFDEMIPRAAQRGAAQLTAGAELVLVAGTSCEVYPAADIPWQVRRQGGRIIEINLEPAAELQADLVLQGGFSEVMGALLAHWSELRR
jgi:NAD-dependent deacetylase